MLSDISNNKNYSLVTKFAKKHTNKQASKQTKTNTTQSKTILQEEGK